MLVTRLSLFILFFSFSRVPSSTSTFPVWFLVADLAWPDNIPRQAVALRILCLTFFFVDFFIINSEQVVVAAERGRGYLSMWCSRYRTEGKVW